MDKTTPPTDAERRTNALWDAIRTRWPDIRENMLKHNALLQSTTHGAGKKKGDE